MGANSSVQLPASKKQWMESMAERLTCTICMDIFIDPVTLPCGHTLCKGCIKGWSSAGIQDQWICPLCKREDAIVYVANLDVNYTLKSLCEEYKDYCKNSHHTASNEEKEETAHKQSNENCERHPKELARYICLTCKEKFCGSCSALERKHSDASHQVHTFDMAVEPVTEIYKQVKQRIAPLFAKIDEKKEALTQALADLSATEAAIKQHCTELKNKLCRLVDSQMSILLQPINNQEVSNGICIGQLEQFFYDAATVQAKLDYEITEQNVFSRATAILPLLGSVEKLEQLVEQYWQSPIQAKPSFHSGSDPCGRTVSLIKESCGTLQVQDTDDARVAKVYRNLPIRNLSKTLKGACNHSDDRVLAINSNEKPTNTSPQPSVAGLATEGSFVWQNVYSSHRGTQTQIRTVEARKMCSISSASSSWKLEHVAWVANYVLVPDMENGCILRINHSSGVFKKLYQYDTRYKPFAVAVCRHGDQVLIAVNVVYKEKYSNVNLHRTDLTVLIASDPLAHIEDNFVGMPAVGYKPVSCTRNLMCCLNKSNDIVLYSVHDKKRVTEDTSRKWDQVHFHCDNAETKLYAKDSDGRIAGYEVTGGHLNYLADYNSSVCESISSLQTDKDGSLWVLDRIGKKLVKFSNNGNVICTLHTNVPWMQQIHSIHFSSRSLLMLAEVDADSTLSGICIPWPPSQRTSSSKKCSYTLSKLIKGT